MLKKFCYQNDVLGCSILVSTALWHGLHAEHRVAYVGMGKQSTKTTGVAYDLPKKSDLVKFTEPCIS